MHPVALLPAALFVFSWTVIPAVGHAELADLSAGGRDSSGIVAGLNGHAAAISGSGVSRELKIGDRVAAGEEIRIGSGGSLELLWERRALFTLKEQSSIALQESKNGSAFLQILEGTIRVAYSYNEGHPTDTMKIRTPGTAMTLRGGIIEAVVEATGIDRPRRTTSRQAEETAGEILRVIEGQVHVEPRWSDAKSFLLKAGYEWQTLPGRGSGAMRPSAAHGRRDLAAVQSHHHVPATQRMVQVHVEHALELERALSKPRRDGNESDGIKGAIVATSLGIPLPIVTGAGATIIATSVAPTVPVGSIPAPVGPVGVPPTTGPVVPTPVIPTPVIPTPGITVQATTQSGGINSLSLLREVLQDVSRQRGRGRGRDRD
jgi:FecR protein